MDVASAFSGRTPFWRAAARNLLLDLSRHSKVQPKRGLTAGDNSRLYIVSRLRFLTVYFFLAR